MDGFARQLVEVLDAARDKLVAEGHVAAEAVEGRLAELKPLLAQDAAAAEAAALDLVKHLFGNA
jgi:hypothetical protein